jgi:chromatin remodeling complex protein RSC6
MSAISSSDASSKMSATAAKSTKASKSAAAPVAAAPAVVTAPVVEAKATKGSKKAAAVPVAAPAPAVAAPAPVTAEAPAAEEDVATKLSKAVARASEIAHQQKALAVEAAANAKEIEKLSARLAKKAGGKKKRASGGGDAFKNPVPVTNELAAFLGLEKGASISRSEVTKRVYAYLKSHGLQKGKIINTDASLRKLLSVKESDEITILNLQKFLNPHYIKATPVAN